MREYAQIPSFWKKVLNTSQIIGKEVLLKPKLCLLNIYQKTLLRSETMYVCKACVWKTEATCVTVQWLRDNTFYFALENISNTAAKKSFGTSGVFSVHFWK